MKPKETQPSLFLHWVGSKSKFNKIYKKTTTKSGSRQTKRHMLNYGFVQMPFKNTIDRARDKQSWHGWTTITLLMSLNNNSHYPSPWAEASYRPKTSAMQQFQKPELGCVCLLKTWNRKIPVATKIYTHQDWLTFKVQKNIWGRKQWNTDSSLPGTVSPGPSCMALYAGSRDGHEPPDCIGSFLVGTVVRRFPELPPPVSLPLRSAAPASLSHLFQLLPLWRSPPEKMGLGSNKYILG